ncbi:hypothetical protein M406DRAFT_339559 [Cryphonectria parasitica EP155]|uniref:Phosphatidylinositol N-acetylglucosaminyltransferase subunit H conserved domain-containing protein n=1 Tax=Cryphonectria parasitica (strain ATCC 38755 / EP155) TaxID=660469 RepID=A0A9P5CQC8_CRYP1|nr:uncharacterized protein M406DRAFT_339559 [Cryphonectria parasitica EP155]KAF3766307.1 hypothetical protein M406DRAFT_339559 [Cryphonectria parasitica EP155]
MLTTSPHLEVRRPSPTTAEFTVTTSPPATISNRLLLGIVFLLRLLLALAALISRALTSLPSSASLPPSALYALCAALLYLTTLRVHTTESLLVLRGLGVQTSSTGGSYLASWRAGTRFIPTEKIRDVLINEAFRGFGVRYYLVVVVDGEDDVVVVFPRLLPGRGIVERVWRGVRGCLWEPPEGDGMVARKVVEDRGGSHG